MISKWLVKTGFIVMRKMAGLDRMNFRGMFMKSKLIKFPFQLL